MDVNITIYLVLWVINIDIRYIYLNIDYLMLLVWNRDHMIAVENHLPPIYLSL